MTKTYSPKLLREIDESIEVHCFGKKPPGKGWVWVDGLPRKFTTDAAASDALDDWLLKEDPCGYSLTHLDHCGIGYLLFSRRHPDLRASHPDKKIARALFALRLMAPNAEVLKKI